mmetsp:Transcript_2018/g.4977  ORF Transcript_2018/g.4977 Transcript_2018/m.4977 type:complete len:204 (+) Transcript_2018:966-1577(+)
MGCRYHIAAGGHQRRDGRAIDVSHGYRGFDRRQRKEPSRYASHHVQHGLRERAEKFVPATWEPAGGPTHHSRIAPARTLLGGGILLQPGPLRRQRALRFLSTHDIPGRGDVDWHTRLYHRVRLLRPRTIRVLPPLRQWKEQEGEEQSSALLGEFESVRRRGHQGHVPPARSGAHESGSRSEGLGSLRGGEVRARWGSHAGIIL